MTEWMAPETIGRNLVSFGKLMHALLGLYIWEWFTSLDFDFMYITGKRKFRWPLIFYFLGRYSLLFALIGITISFNVTTRVDCQALYQINSIFGQMSIGLASINLSLRTMAVWSQKWFIVVPLVCVILGHWSLLLHGILVKASWDEVTQTCVITGTSSQLLAATFIYSMVFDFLVLCLTAYKLFFPATTRSRLVNLIFQDGLIFFVIAFLANLVATVFMLLNLNPVMSIIANVPAAIASTIVACRAVRRLTSFTTKGPEMFANSTQGSTLAFRSGFTSRAKVATKVTTTIPNKGVHVQMETVQHSTPKAFGEYDGSATNKDDVESQHGSDAKRHF